MAVVPRQVVFHSTLTLPAAAQPQLPAEMLKELCKADRPLSLSPVRLETRFFAQPDRSSELRVRVYPDRIHIDSHETALTPAEKTWGEHYWTQVWRAGNDAQAQQNAWRQLADRYDAQRAGWIARMLRPTNLQARPPSPVPADTVLSPAPAFPAVAAVEGEDAAWRHPPLSRLMPDRWVAIVQSGGRPVIAVAGPNIKPELAVGPDPQAPEGKRPGDQPALDEGMKWMADFPEGDE